MRRRALFLALVLPLLFFLFAPTAFASEEDGQTSFTDNADGLLKDFSDILPDAAKENLGQDTLDADTLTRAVGFKQIFSLLAESASGSWKQNGGMLGKMLGTALCFSVVSLLGGFFGKSRFGQILFSAAPALFFYQLLFPVTERVFAFIFELSSFSALLSPLYAAVYSSGGALGSAAAASSGFTVFVGVLHGLVGGILSPLLKILFALSLLSPLTEGALTGEIEKRLRGAYVFLLSLVCVLLGASLAFESSLASSADSVAIRTVKFTVGQSIPLVGASISSMLGTLSSSLSLVKSAFGAGALIALLSLLLPVLAELLLCRFALSFCAFLSSSMGAKTVGSVCERYRGIFDLMLAAVAITGAMFLLLVGIFSKSMG